MNNALMIHDFLKKYKKLFVNELFITPKVLVKQDFSSNSNAKDELKKYETSICNCQKCHLAEIRKNFVFGSGDPNADLMLVGEAPGEEEDSKGVPLIGKAGKLLDKILSAIDMNRFDGVFILNILKCKTPNNRDPLPSEVGKCDPYLQKQIKIIKPKLIVALGKIAGKNLIKKDIPLNDMRGNTFDYYGKPLRITYHPTALLRNQSLKKLAWDDFQWIKEYMKKVNG